MRSAQSMLRSMFMLLVAALGLSAAGAELNTSVSGETVYLADTDANLNADSDSCPFVSIRGCIPVYELIARRVRNGRGWLRH